MPFSIEHRLRIGSIQIGIHGVCVHHFDRGPFKCWPSQLEAARRPFLPATGELPVWLPLVTAALTIWNMQAKNWSNANLSPMEFGVLLSIWRRSVIVVIFFVWKL